ncbi:MAG: DUF1573 domain-containing protein [Anaerolineae bacterium]|jgi:hypothetical protein|nr:DUF1573 domain-containing protein [Anaerolineae bacterium]
MSHIAKQKEHARKGSGLETRIALILIGAVFLLWGALLAVNKWSEVQTTQAVLAYEDGDIATEKPIKARHDMGEGPPIPFLPKDGPQPSISLSEWSYDFGKIGPTDIVQRTFVIRNDGEAPLTISRAYTTCGCTTAKISASVIPPGKVAIVEIVFDAGFHGITGQTVRRGVIIENNDPDSPQAEFWVQVAVQSN